MPDHATQALKAIKESGKYAKLPNVVIFDAHEEFDEDGNLVRHFGREELQELCDITNKRAEGGDPTVVGLGHTIPRDPVTRMPVPEDKQPRMVGYAMDLRVGQFGPHQKTGILVDYYIEKDKLEEWKTYTRGRSIELWPKKKVIDWVASLRKAPQRDLGPLDLELLTFSRDSLEAFTPTRRYYGDASKTRLLAVAQRGEKLFYAMNEVIQYAGQFDETKHKRDEGGKFSHGHKESEEAEEASNNALFHEDHHKAATLHDRAAAIHEHHAALEKSPALRQARLQLAATHKAKAAHHRKQAGGEPARHAMDSGLEEVEDIDQNDNQDIDSDGQKEATMDPTKPPDAMAPDDDFCQKIDRYMAEKYPVLKRMCDEATQRYAMESNPNAVGAPEGAKLAPEQNSPAENLGGNMPPGEGMPDEDSTGDEDEDDTGPGFPGATNSAIPGTKKKKKKGEPMAEEKNDKVRMEKDAEAIRYARLEEEVKQLREARVADQAAAKKAKATQRIQSLQFQGFTLDPVREVERYCALDEATWDKEDEHIKRYYKQDSVGMVPMGGTIDVAGMPQMMTKEKGRLSEAQMRTAVNVASKKNIPFEDAASQVLAGQV